MGNKLYVDSKISQIEDIISFPLEGLENFELEGESQETIITNHPYQNLKVWCFYENEHDDEDQIKSKGILLPNIREDHFLLSSYEAYIILLVYKGKNDICEITSFPTSLWGIVESSSNMTPRGLMYAFSSSNSQNLESFLLSKRDFHNSEYKFVLFIWNGKNSSPLLKSTVLMRAFDLDKKLMTPIILPYLYHGFSIKGNTLEKGGVVNLNEIINNTFENMQNEEILPTPSSETISNYHETVYLLKWLYPIDYGKKGEKKQDSTSSVSRVAQFHKFNTNFINTSFQKSYFDNFIILPIAQMKKNERKKDDAMDEEIDIPINDEIINESENPENDETEELFNEEMDVVEDHNITHKESSEDEMNVIKATKAIPVLKNVTSQTRSINMAKINIGDINKTTSSNDTDNSSLNAKDNSKEITAPKLLMSFQHKILNEDLISQRTKQKTEEEEQLDTVSPGTLRKTSENILKNNNFTKIQIKGLALGSATASDFNKKGGGFNLNFKDNLKKEVQNSAESEDLPIDIDSIQDNYDLKDFERKQLVMDYFSKTMNEIIPNFLYISSYTVAKSREIVSANQITHIINCAADVCQNHFEGENGYTYLTFHLKDHSMENVESIFYEVIKFIESAKEKNGKVLVHCIQGISRSVTLVLAYIIFTHKINYDEAFKLVQSKRSIACPNLGFSIQLQDFYQRLFEPPEHFRHYPKIFAVSSFQTEQHDKFVCRLMNEPFYENRSNGSVRVFDKRGVFIVVTFEHVYVWIGSKVTITMKLIYMTIAMNYISTLQKFENAPRDKVIEITDGYEPEEFLKLWLSSPEKFNYYRTRFSDIINEWNNWYKEIDNLSSLDEPSPTKKKSFIGSQGINNKSLVSSVDLRKAFFVYPDIEPENLFDLDDLNERIFLCACVENLTENKFYIHLWKGPSNNLNSEEMKEYLESIKSSFFSEHDIEKVQIIEEIPYSESDEFMNLL